jgi:beta-lactamase superfamily II metal-dependent hydrolase
VLNRLNDVGARTYRTDIDGAIHVRTDGRSFTVRTAR